MKLDRRVRSTRRSAKTGRGMVSLIALVAAVLFAGPGQVLANLEVPVESFTVFGTVDADNAVTKTFGPAGSYKVVIRDSGDDGDIGVLFDRTTHESSKSKASGGNDPKDTWKFLMGIEVVGRDDIAYLGDGRWYATPQECYAANIHQFTVLQLPEDNMTVKFYFIDNTPYDDNTTGRMDIDIYEYPSSTRKVTVLGNHPADSSQTHIVKRYFQPGTYKVTVSSDSEAIKFDQRTSDKFYKISIHVKVYEQSVDEGSIIQEVVLGDPEFVDNSQSQPRFKYDPDPTDPDNYVHDRVIDAFLHNQSEFVTFTIPEVPDNVAPDENFRTQRRLQDGTEVTFEFVDPEGDYSNNEGFVNVDIAPADGQNIPTLSEWGLIAFVGILLAYMMWTMARRRDESSLNAA